MDETVTLLVGGLELALWFAGVVLIVRIALNPERRASLKTPLLPAWNIRISDFFLFLLFIMGGTVLVGFLAAPVVRWLGLRGDAVTVSHGAAAQLGMLAGFFAFKARRALPPHATATPPVLHSNPEMPLASASGGYGALNPSSPRVLGGNIFVSGLFTFLVALPFLVAAVRVWEIVLTHFGLPVDRQDLVGMFANAESPWMIVIMVALAVVIAPITEELVFRAGLYRFLRTRIPRWIALIAPALFFAALHVDWHSYRGLASLMPLVVLAVIFSLAYEHTGRIGTVIVAHALFNLNTVLMILGGVADE